MRYLPRWRSAVERGWAHEVLLASCAFYDEFGTRCPFKKEFCLLNTNIDLTTLHRRCPGFHSHVKIGGSLSRESGSYWRGILAPWAAEVASFVRARRRELDSIPRSRPGREQPPLTELADALLWRVDSR